MKLLIYIAFVQIALFSCKPEAKHINKQALAQVGGKFLYVGEIQTEFNNRNKELIDSAMFFKNYIDWWVRQQLYVDHIEKSLSPSELDLKKELEYYRQELLIQKFNHKKAVQLDIISVSNIEIEQYYKQNESKFILDYPIVKVDYIVFPRTVSLPRNFANKATSTNPDEKSAAEEFIYQSAKKYDNFDNEWIYFDNIIQNTELNIGNANLFLRNNKSVDFIKYSDLHFVLIKEHIPSGEMAPLEFVAAQISSTLHNKKKLDFLRVFKDSLYQDGLKYNKFSVFNK